MSLVLHPPHAGAATLATAGDTAAASVSIVVPCRNEGSSVERLLDGLREQDWPIHEVVVVDDGSTDDTARRLAAYGSRFPEFPLRVVGGSVAGIPAAVNAGVRAARGDIVIRLDAHSCPAPDYVRWSVSALDGLRANVAGGVWEIAPGARTLMARAIARGISHPMGAGDAAYRTGRAACEAQEVDTVPFGCFRKVLWEEIGGFNEDLLSNEDYEFNYRVRRNGHRVLMDPRIRSTYFSRATLREVARQYFRYGWWKAQMLKANPRSLRWRQAVPPGFVATSIVLSGLSLLFPSAAVMLAGLAVVYLTALLAASACTCYGRRTLSILPLLPLVFSTIHFAWGTGLLVNLLTFGRWPAMRRVSRQGIS